MAYAGFIHGFMFGDTFENGLTFRMGQTHVKKYLAELLEYVSSGALRPGVVISHTMDLSEAATGYQLFNDREDGCRKVVLRP